MSGPDDKSAEKEADKTTDAAGAEDNKPEASSDNNLSDSTPVSQTSDDKKEIIEPTDKTNSESESSGSASTASASSDSSAEETKNASSLTLTQHHVSHLLSDVLQDDSIEEAAPLKGIRFPMIFDCLLGVGLLVAVGGFTIGLFHMYIVHSASQLISEQRYDKAITVLKGAPLPQVFSRPGSDTEELLSKAQYLDAMDKLEANQDIEIALKELGEIHPGSKYFALAQEAINENTEPAPIMLQGGAETTEQAAPNAEEKQSLLDKTLKEEEKK